MKESTQNFFGDTVQIVCKSLVLEAQQLNEEVFFKFNDITIIAHKNSDPNKLVESFLETNQKRLHDYYNSKEYKQKCLKEKKETEQNQKKMDLVMKKMDSIDFHDLDSIINWWLLFESNHYSGVYFHTNQIIQTFESKGYKSNANIGISFNSENKENVARYIIGQCLQGIQSHGHINPIVHKFAREWREKFN